MECVLCCVVVLCIVSYRYQGRRVGRLQVTASAVGWMCTVGSMYGVCSYDKKDTGHKKKRQRKKIRWSSSFCLWMPSDGRRRRTNYKLQRPYNLIFRH